MIIIIIRKLYILQVQNKNNKNNTLHSLSVSREGVSIVTGVGTCARARARAPALNCLGLQN